MSNTAWIDNMLREVQQRLSRRLARLDDDDDGAIGAGVRTRRDPPMLTGRAAVEQPKGKRGDALN